MAAVMTKEHLQMFREKQGWSQAEMARRLEIPVYRYRGYEAGAMHGKPLGIPRYVYLACVGMRQLGEAI